jgi:quercetin dioxygenase-like cupin family protein
LVKRAIAALASVLVATGVARGAQAQQLAPLRRVLDNATVSVMRLELAPGAREPIGDGKTPIVLIEVSQRQAIFLAAGTNQRASNNRSEPLDLVIVKIKPARPPAPAAPPTAAPPGITRDTLIDNADVRVVRVQFAPGSREPVHTHPNDLLTVQISSGQLEMTIGPENTSGTRDAGFVQFLPRDVPHTYGSVDTKPFELLSVSIK